VALLVVRAGPAASRSDGARGPKGAEPAALVAQAADAVRRVAEVREAYPEIEASGGERVDADTLGTGRPFP
jgi:tRNA U54 and U55 pseudouridine synthase Pus10